FAIILARLFIPRPNRAPEKKPFDWIGTALMFAAIASFIIVIERGVSLGWNSPFVITLVAVFVVTFIGYIVHSLKSRNPLINIRIFKHWKFTFVAISYMLTCMVFGGVMYMIPYYLEIPLGITPAEAGLLLIISSAITALIGIPVGMWCDRIGCRTPCILAAICRITFCVLMFIIKPEWGVIAVIPVLVFMGLSFGISGGPATTRIVQNAPKGEEGSGTSIMITTDFIGGVVGVAAYTLAFAIGAPASIGISVNELSGELFVTGFHATAVLGIIIGITTLILSWAVPNIIVKKSPENSAGSE
ncbi:MAG TPA: MFS transporter, partial [Methanocorpusculum sp.]|nr:MFS transporter [Methanocorpusculum sp.]